MKKILTGMILTVMAAALAACGNGVAEDREQPQDTGISISADVEQIQFRIYGIRKRMILKRKQKH